MTVRQAYELHFATMKLTGARAQIAGEVLKEINARLGFLLDVGLDYLTLDRAAATLSGGEAQRIRLASQLGSELSGVMYVLDEPSIGLHQRDNVRLIAHAAPAARPRQHACSSSSTTRRRSRRPTTSSTSARAPGATAARSSPRARPRSSRRTPASLTGPFLSGAERIEVPDDAPRADGLDRAVTGAREHNLQERRRRSSRSACWSR